MVILVVKFPREEYKGDRQKCKQSKIGQRFRKLKFFKNLKYRKVNNKEKSPKWIFLSEKQMINIQMVLYFEN